MLFQNANLVLGKAATDTNLVVKAQTRLSEIIKTTGMCPFTFLLVEDESGNPIGIVAADDLRHRLESTLPSERKRWLDMPVESALNGRMHMVPTGDPAAKDNRLPPDSCCTVISRGTNMVALMTEHDVLISWRSVEQTLVNALNDSVTQLPNRAAFDRHLKLECQRAQRSGHSVAVVLFDVDHFKQINDRFGHAAGDAVLHAVGQCLRRSLRSYDLVARYGGDEFACICSGCLPGEIDLTLQRIVRSFEQLRFDTSIPGKPPTLSIGACVVHDESELNFPDRIPGHADKCLYLAKRNGRNQAFATEIGVPTSSRAIEPAVNRHKFSPVSARLKKT